eukprot:6697447-Lingulodinium_polyedra.AAC.1
MQESGVDFAKDLFKATKFATKTVALQPMDADVVELQTQCKRRRHRQVKRAHSRLFSGKVVSVRCVCLGGISNAEPDSP